jgi:tungstate transport system ATP-binding protein
MTPQLRLASVRKRYGSRVALELDELTVFPGRLYTLTGPNGSGKSTLLSLMALLMRPEHGKIWFAGQAVNWGAKQLRQLRRQVTLVHQAPYLFAGDVAGNVGFGLKVRQTGSREVQRAVSRALATVGMAGFEERNVRQLSGGEARRVALARALVLEPAVLLLDEPLANLDEESAAIIEHLVTGLPAQGTTVVMSTHDLAQAERMATDVIRLVDGRISPTQAQRIAGRETDFHKAEICPVTKKHDVRSLSTPLPLGWSVWKFLTQWRG